MAPPAALGVYPTPHPHDLYLNRTSEQSSSEKSLPTHALADGLRGLYNAGDAASQTIRSQAAACDEFDDPPVVRPSIKLQPDLKEYEARVQRLKEQRQLGPNVDTLPPGFPLAISGDRVWSGTNLSGEDFVIHLQPAHCEEIKTALEHFKGIPGNNGPDQICKDLFPLPELGPVLEQMAKDLHVGRGVFILRGLDPKGFSPYDNVLLFTGLTSYISEQRGCQDRFGHMLTHLVDMKFQFGADSKRTPAFTGGALPYHNDVCDILAMYVQDCSVDGGDSILASSAAVYNEIAAIRPDVIRTLADPIWVYDKDKPPAVWQARPILFPEETHGPFFCFSRQKITGSEHYPLSSTIPAMTEEQAEALDMVHYIAEKHGIVLDLKPGDVLLYNNLGVLHGREAFSDTKDAEHHRHILRLWLRNPELAWKTPAALHRDWFLVYGESERRARAQWKMTPEQMEKDRIIGHKMTCS